MDETQDVIAAFVDHERVDAADLVRALERAEGREYLVDLLAMRELVERQTQAATVPVLRSTSPRRGVLAVAAAAMVIVGGLAGYHLGRRAGLVPDEVSLSAAPTTGMSAPAVSVPGIAAPPPTKVIRLERGADWTESRGGI
jgi:hypothetical protein